MNICESLTVTSKLFPDRIALVFDDRKFTYRELNRLSASAAKQLAQMGVVRGDRVALMLGNTPAFPIWYYAALRIGAIAVSISTRLAASEVEYVIDDCSARAFVFSDRIENISASQLPDCVVAKIETDISGELYNGVELPREAAEELAWVKTERDEAALILYTSGTTGFPKGATLSHGNVRSNVFAFNHLCDMRPDDRILLAVPLFHCFGQNALLNSALNVGATLVLQQKFDLNEARDLIKRYEITQLYGVPMMFQLLAESCQAEELSSVRYCFSAAANLPIQVSHKWLEKFGQPLFEGYGLTETSPFASYNHRIRYLPGSIGTPIDSVEIKIVDTETGKDCGPNELGEIAIRGPNVMLGYWNRPEETATAIRDGWFYSGDIGQQDEDGFLFIVDRVKDMISVGGLKVFPAEVERVLLDLETVVEAAVVGAPDGLLGEQVVAYLRVADGESEQAVIAAVHSHAKQFLASYKVPRRILIVDEIPRNASGKVLKSVLRERAKSLTNDSPDLGIEVAENSKFEPTLVKTLAQTHASEQQRVATNFVQELVMSITDSSEVPAPEIGLLEAGMDSLMLVELSAQVQLEVGQELPTTFLFEHPRIADLAKFMVSTIAEERNHSQNTEVKNAAGLSNDSLQDHSNQNDLDHRKEVEEMSEEQALEALLDELKE